MMVVAGQDCNLLTVTLVTVVQPCKVNLSDGVKMRNTVTSPLTLVGHLGN